MSRSWIAWEKEKNSADKQKDTRAAGQLEVVDRHVLEDAAAALHVLERRRRGVARAELHHDRLADGALAAGGGIRTARPTMRMMSTFVSLSRLPLTPCSVASAADHRPPPTAVALRS